MDTLQIPPKPDAGIPRWTKERYDGMEKDIAEYLYSVAFWERWNGREESLLDTTGKARAVAEARFVALAHSFDLSEAVERSKVWQLYLFKKNGWHHILGGEYDSIKDVLLVIRDHLDPDDSRIGQLDFLIETFLPALEQKGVPAEILTGVPDNYSKAIEAVPKLRRSLDLDDIDGAKEIIAKIVDPNESVRSVKEWLKDSRPALLEKIRLETYLLPGQGELTVLRLPSAAHKRFVQMALRQILEGEETHAGLTLAQELASLVLGKKAPER